MLQSDGQLSVFSSISGSVKMNITPIKKVNAVFDTFSQTNWLSWQSNSSNFVWFDKSNEVN